MADDARISTALPNHPKTKKLRKRLGSEGCWSLVCLFLFTATSHWDGDLSNMSDEDIELAAEWDGNEGEFVKAIVQVGFLDGEPGHYKVHDWEEHNPFAATKGVRVAQARAAVSKRWANVKNALSIPTVYEQNTDSNTHHTTPHHTTNSQPENQNLSSNGATRATQPDSHAEIVRTEVWPYYLKTFQRSEKTYSWTDLRRLKGVSRFRECLQKTRGDPAKAAELMKLVVDNIAASDFHMGRDAKSNGKKYIEWEKNLFKSREQMEYWWNL